MSMNSFNYFESFSGFWMKTRKDEDKKQNVAEERHSSKQTSPTDCNDKHFRDVSTQTDPHREDSSTSSPSPPASASLTTTQEKIKRDFRYFFSAVKESVVEFLGEPEDTRDEVHEETRAEPKVTKEKPNEETRAELKITKDGLKEETRAEPKDSKAELNDENRCESSEQKKTNLDEKEGYVNKSEDLISMEPELETHSTELPTSSTETLPTCTEQTEIVCAKTGGVEIESSEKSEKLSKEQSEQDNVCSKKGDGEAEKLDMFEDERRMELTQEDGTCQSREVDGNEEVDKDRGWLNLKV